MRDAISTKPKLQMQLQLGKPVCVCVWAICNWRSISSSSSFNSICIQTNNKYLLPLCCYVGIMHNFHFCSIYVWTMYVRAFHSRARINDNHHGVNMRIFMPTAHTIHLMDSIMDAVWSSRWNNTIGKSGKMQMGKQNIKLKKRHYCRYLCAAYTQHNIVKCVAIVLIIHFVDFTLSPRLAAVDCEFFLRAGDRAVCDYYAYMSINANNAIDAHVRTTKWICVYQFISE